jgi:hypothetical protein
MEAERALCKHCGAVYHCVGCCGCIDAIAEYEVNDLPEDLEWPEDANC